MRMLIAACCVLTAGCQGEQPEQRVMPVHSRGPEISPTERTELERKAANGSAEAAWRLYTYHSLTHHVAGNATPWLNRAVELEHPQAQRRLASLIKTNKALPEGYGSTVPAAVENLLERSSRTDGDACCELASLYAEGYFGAVDHEKARLYFARGAAFANPMCWTKLSRYYRLGLGGPRNDAEAYYWISLDANCVDPRSVSGQQTSAVRDEIAGHLPLLDLERTWKKVDDFMAQVAARKIIVGPGGLFCVFSRDREAESRRVIKQNEDEHRKKWKAKTA